MNEKRLLHRLRRGDESVLPELIRQYSGYAYAIASNILSHALGEEDIEEVVSDSFLSIWENRENIETEMLKAYLAAIVRNKAKTAVRKHHEEEPLEDDLLQISIPN
ncbi:MAG: sigma factor, partial [Acutalibacteraceae bacterium]|nr:sigma factor [Acutalibacteraceae bacterium]